MYIEVRRIVTAAALLAAQGAVAADQTAWSQLSAERQPAAVSAVVGKPIAADVRLDPQPSTLICVMQMEYEETSYSLIPIIGGLSWKKLSGSAVVNCPERGPVRLSLRGEGPSIGIQLPSGGNPFVHRGSRVSGAVNIRVPSLITPKQFEGTYVNAGVSTPIGGAEFSPWINTSLDFQLAIYLPASLEGTLGVGLKSLKLTLD